jgi:hypothetical protein
MKSLTLAAFLADLPAPLRTYLAARLVEVPGGHWLWIGPVSYKAGGGGRGRPKCGVWLETPAGRVWFTLPYRLLLTLRFGPALPGYSTALHKCRYNNRHVGFCCAPHPRHVIWGPDCENVADRRKARAA